VGAVWQNRLNQQLDLLLPALREARFIAHECLQHPHRGLRVNRRYRQLGLAEPGFLVARDAAEYARIAVKLGADPAFRSAARRAICARRHRLFDAPEVAEEWAAFLERVARPFL